MMNNEMFKNTGVLSISGQEQLFMMLQNELQLPQNFMFMTGGWGALRSNSKEPFCSIMKILA